MDYDNEGRKIIENSLVRHQRLFLLTFDKDILKEELISWFFFKRPSVLKVNLFVDDNHHLRLRGRLTQIAFVVDRVSRNTKRGTQIDMTAGRVYKIMRVDCTVKQLLLWTRPFLCWSKLSRLNYESGFYLLENLMTVLVRLYRLKQPSATGQ